MPRDASPILCVVRGPMLAIVCEPCGRRGRYSVARPIEEHSNAKLTDLFCDAGLARALSLKLTMPRLWRRGQRSRPLREVSMTETARDLVIVMTRGTDHELSSVAFTIANGGLTAGLKVYAFLTSAAVDLVRKRAIDLTHAPPLDPLDVLVADFLKRGGVIWACPPCVKARGYTEDDFIEGVAIQGASAMHALIQKGAATLSF